MLTDKYLKKPRESWKTKILFSNWISYVGDSNDDLLFIISILCFRRIGSAKLTDEATPKRASEASTAAFEGNMVSCLISTWWEGFLFEVIRQKRDSMSWGEVRGGALYTRRLQISHWACTCFHALLQINQACGKGEFVCLFGTEWDPVIVFW